MGEQPYHKLVVWKEAYKFVLDIYFHTQTFPKEEMYGITSQLRRASVSIVANIVEGQGKATRPDFIRYLDIAKGSIRECAVLLEFSRDLKYLSIAEYQKLDDQQNRTAYLLNQLIDSQHQKPPSKPPEPPEPPKLPQPNSYGKA